MRIQVEMTEGKDFPETNIKDDELALRFADKIMKRLGMSKTDETKILLKRKK